MHHPTDRIAHTTAFVTKSEGEIHLSKIRNHLRGKIMYITNRKEGKNYLFNDALNTFHLWLYGIIHTYHSDSERGNSLPPLHRLLFPISSKGYYPTYRTAHTTTFVTPVVGHWLEREIAQCVHHDGSIP